MSHDTRGVAATTFLPVVGLLVMTIVLPSAAEADSYATKAQARQELQRGIGPGSHMTARATAERPLNPVQAQSRYGLLQKPEVCETSRLPKGQPIRSNRVVGGAAGVRELTPPEAIEKVGPIR